MKKAILPLATLALIGASACGGNPEKKLEVQKEQVAEAPILRKPGFNVEETRDKWVVHYDTLRWGLPELPVLQAVRLLPISYEYNYKDGIDINGVWCGIEGRTGASLTRRNPDGGLDTEILFDIYGRGETPVVYPRHLEGEIPEGYSLVAFRNTGRKTTERELNRVLNAFELYVNRYGDEIRLGLTKEEMITLRNSFDELKKNMLK